MENDAFIIYEKLENVHLLIFIENQNNFSNFRHRPVQSQATPASNRSQFGEGNRRRQEEGISWGGKI